MKKLFFTTVMLLVAVLAFNSCSSDTTDLEDQIAELQKQLTELSANKDLADKVSELNEKLGKANSDVSKISKEIELIRATNGHDYVDLGLPSGNLWATVNYDVETSQDIKNIWGGKWKLPDFAEMKELLDNCSSAWTADYKHTGFSGVIVYKVKNEKDKGTNWFNPQYKPTEQYDVKNDLHIFLPVEKEGSSTYWTNGDENHNSFYINSDEIAIENNKYENTYYSRPVCNLK